MKCLHPIIIPILQAYGTEFHNVGVPCGHCEACLYNRARDWQNRLREEMKVSSSALFVTLTYSDENLKYAPLIYGYDKETGECLTSDFLVPTVCPQDLTKFWKRLRKALPQAQIRYFSVSEYGPENLRPHYHCIIFNVPKEKCNNKFFEKVWGLGFTTTKRLTNGRICYATKYCFGGLFVPRGYAPNFMRCSTKPAIGYKWLETLEKMLETKELDDCYYFRDGYKFPVPKYYSRKIKERFTDDEKIFRLLRYCAERSWLDSDGVRQDIERQKKYDETGDWYDTEAEIAKERFLKRFYKNYYKNRKL